MIKSSKLIHRQLSLDLLRQAHSAALIIMSAVDKELTSLSAVGGPALLWTLLFRVNVSTEC